jgi:predicted HTH domain antitoxin
MIVTIPDERIGSIQLDERDVLVDIAIGLYKREQVSLGRAAEIANMSSPAFLNELGRRKIPINYEINDLHADLACLDPTAYEVNSRPIPGVTLAVESL